MPDSSTPPDISQRPLLLFMERLDAWRASARREDFWRDTVEHRRLSVLDDPKSSPLSKRMARKQAKELFGRNVIARALGVKPAREVIDAAKADGISQRTLERAKPQVGVVARREGY